MHEIIKSETTRFGFTVSLHKWKGIYTTKWVKYTEKYDICVNDMVLMSTYSMIEAIQCYGVLMRL